MTPPTDAWLDRLRGRFIVLDGPDGCGKTTQFHRLARFLREAGLAVCDVREPGGTPIGEKVRAILLDPTHERMDLRCEMLLYMASRAQVVAERIAPAQARGEVVLADRFLSSTLAYQGAAGGLSQDDIRTVGRIALGGCQPDLVVVFDVDDRTAATRLLGNGRMHAHISLGAPTLFSDRIEIRGLDYWLRVRAGFLDQARAEPERYRVVDARPDADTVFAALLAALRGRFAQADQPRG